MSPLKPIKNAVFRAYVRFMEMLGWGYWAYYPATSKLIWTRKECGIYGVPCDTAVKVADYTMFSNALLNDSFRNYCAHAVEMSGKSGLDFHLQFIARNQTTQQIIFIEARGRWVFENGKAICLHGFNRLIEPHCFQSKYDQLNMRRIISEWMREGQVPVEFMTYGTARK